MIGRPSLAENLFRRIKEHPGYSDSVAFLRSLVLSTPPTDETEYLDFKSASVPPFNGAPEKDLPEKDLKKTWSEAIAGFATTSGGVLIWGIDARKPQNGKIDQACGFNLALKPLELKARLKSFQLQATDPPVPDIQIEAFEDPAEGGKGFVVCYIPESPYKPHRAELEGRRWVMRSGDNFVDLPVAVLRSLFYPHRQSYLFLKMTCRHRIGPNAQQCDVAIVTFSPLICSEGPATAENVFVLVPHRENMIVEVPRSWRGGSAARGWEVELPAPIHPGQFVEFCSITVEFPVDAARTPIFGSNEFAVEFQFFARDQVPFTISVAYSPEDLAKQASKTGLPVPHSLDRSQ